MCVDATGETYTGSATWVAESRLSFRILFGTSSIVVSNGGARFGEPDWTEVKIASCGVEDWLLWDLQATCGAVQDGGSLPARAKPGSPSVAEALGADVADLADDH